MRLIGVIGSSGRLGSAVVKILTESRLFEVEPLSARDLPEKIQSSLWIYAALPPALPNVLEKAVSNSVSLVIGTTGISSDFFEQIKKSAKKIPIFYTPNFSLGIAIMQKWAADAAKKFHSDAHIDLIDIHHALKKDQPSGTALWLAETIEKNQPLKSPCRLHSLRTGAVPGQHTLSFNTPEEKLTISHEAHSTLAFGRGAVAAAQFLQGKPPGLYGMDDLLLQNDVL